MNHPVWDTYIDLINSDTMYFKYGLLWYCLSLHIKSISISTRFTDMFDDFKFLEHFTINQIKEELQDKLNNAFNNYDPKTNEKFLIHDIVEYLNLSNGKSCDQMANKIYDLFIDICKNYDDYSCPKDLFDEECKKYHVFKNIALELICGANLVIRRFIEFELIHNTKDLNYYSLIKDYVKITFNKDYDILY